MEPGERWSTRIDEGVLVVEFPHGTGISPASGEALLDRWRSLVADSSIEAVVVVVRTDRPCSDAGRQTLRQSVTVALERGVTRFAVVAERPKRRYLERTLDVGGIAIEPFNDEATALRWAKRESAGPAPSPA
ncbi:hypothetical protein SAMN04488066_1216 [Halorubrum aquaticum]|uniref:SpoIIAA-like n=1 Tax=Halorubrum aquaticum TaxID=387340 RepID=A0A1I3CBR4_9EURY|nr:hypothetical protein [Halorubrum aquaticum]SFH71873.1 hypothetical protein SAMN04488066_1216 [Halorubrum aquaticum]